MLNNNLYQNQATKNLTKTDLTRAMGLFLLPIYAGTVQSSNPKVSIIIAALCIIAMMILYFSKLMRKELSYAEVCKNYGILGIIGSVTMAGMFSVSVTADYKKSIIIFFVFLIAQAIIIASMELKSRKNNSENNKMKSVIGISMVPFSVLGLYLSRYVDLNIKIVGLIFVVIFWLVCVSFYNYFIKCRKNEIGNQSRDNELD